MEKITNISELNAAIHELEYLQQNDWPLLKEEFLITYENLRPANFLKYALKELTDGPDIKNDLVNTSLGLAAGYLTKKLIFGTSTNPIKQLLGNFLQMGVSNIVTNNADALKSAGKQAITNILHQTSQTQMK